MNLFDNPEIFGEGLGHPLYHPVGGFSPTLKKERNSM
jgi:hypothetical protein